MENKQGDGSWDFLLNASGTDIYDVNHALSISGIKDSVKYSPLRELDCILIHRYGKKDPVGYGQFIDDICEDLSIMTESGEDSLAEKENSILLFILTKTIKSFNKEQLDEFRRAAGLINTDKDALIREMTAKASYSEKFSKILPFITSSVLGVGIGGLASLSAVGLGAFVVSRVIGAAIPVVGGVLAVGSILMGMGKQRGKNAQKILPVVTVLIRIRREYEYVFASPKSAVDYLRSLIQSNETENKAGFATAMLVAFLRADDSFEQTEMLNQMLNQMEERSGFSASSTISERKLEVLKPYYDQCESFLTSYVTDNTIQKINEIHNIQLQLESTIQSLSPQENTEDPVAEISSEDASRKIAELEARVLHYERILHGIRHNIAPYFTAVLLPYKRYLEGYDMDSDKVKFALNRGKRVASVLKSAGVVDFGAPESLNLSERIKDFFKDVNYVVVFSEIPNNAIVCINKNDFEIRVLNNIKMNIDKHAFGGISEDVLPFQERRVRIRILDDEPCWCLCIANNGKAFPDKASIERIWEYGVSYGSDMTEDGGTGMFFIKETVEHFGGTVSFLRLNEGDYSVEYVIRLQKGN